jgi:hypothetical protein
MHPMLFEKLLAFVRLQGLAVVRAPRGSAAPGSQLFSEMLSRIGGTFIAFSGSNLSLWHGNLIGRLFKKRMAPMVNSKPRVLPSSAFCVYKNFPQRFSANSTYVAG